MDGYQPDERARWYATDNGRNTVVLFFAVIFSLIVWRYSSRETAALLSGTVIILYSVASLKWHLRSKLWFWVVLSIFATAHLLCAFFVTFHLPEVPAISYALPVVMVDGGIMYGVLSVIEKRTRRV